MHYELSKSQKKIARTIIDKGLNIHYIKILKDAESIISDWSKGKFKDSREAYMKLYSSVRKNDKHLGQIYDDKGGSRWIEIIAFQLSDGVITIEDLRDFDEEVRNTIVQWSRILE